MAEIQAGWYPDPSGDQTKLRYWNGVQWTNDFANVPFAQPQGAQGTGYYNPGGDLSRVPQAYYQQPAYSYQGSNDQTLALVAFIFCIVSLVSFCWFLIPLAWMIPMTVHTWAIYKGEKLNTVGFGVCTLIFVNPVSGIMLLVAKKY